jgi:hypothetical protein
VTPELRRKKEGKILVGKRYGKKYQDLPAVFSIFSQKIQTRITILIKIMNSIYTRIFALLIAASTSGLTSAQRGRANTWPQSVDRTAQKNEVQDKNQCNLEAEITLGFLRSITAPKGTGHPLSALYTAQNLLDNCEGALSEKNQADLCDEVDRIKPLVLEKIALPSIPQCAGSISAQQLQHANTWPRRTLQHANTWPRRSLQHANTSPLELQRSKTAPFSTADDFCIPSGVYVGGNGGICDKCCGNRCIVHYTRPGGCPDGYDICLGYYCS